MQCPNDLLSAILLRSREKFPLTFWVLPKFFGGEDSRGRDHIVTDDTVIRIVRVAWNNGDMHGDRRGGDQLRQHSDGALQTLVETPDVTTDERCTMYSSCRINFKIWPEGGENWQPTWVRLAGALQPWTWFQCYHWPSPAGWCWHWRLRWAAASCQPSFTWQTSSATPS